MYFIEMNLGIWLYRNMSFREILKGWNNLYIFFIIFKFDVEWINCLKNYVIRKFYFI